jgi:hypothetical protein
VAAGRFDVPDEGYIWLTTEARQALQAIAKPMERKKRDTVVLLACQAAGMLLHADGRSWNIKAVFRDPRVCSETIWYTKWKEMPDVARALEVCVTAAQQYTDRQTAVIEAIASRQLREALAAQVGVAVETLVGVETGEDTSARDRLEAVRMHIGAVAPEYAARMMPAAKAAVPVDLVNPVEFGEVTTDELRAIEGALRREAGGGSTT